ncbi:MAG: copper resistance protein CopC, partial [Dehalococcoidia bacterium]|nr:copper resistance protein CopC [Dehalococcoidia bacterium]
MVRKLPISPRIIGLGLLGLTLGVAASLAFAAGGAEAHGVHVASLPAPNAQIEDPPELIKITFSEPIEPSVSTIRLFDGSAQEIPLGAYEFSDDPKVLGVRVPSELESSVYTIVWRNLSTVDGHIWSGSFPFTVLGAGGEVPTATASVELAGLTANPSDSPSALESAARWV